MSQWETNKYFSFQDADSEGLQIVTDLLNSYALTRGCLETLGQELKNKLEFGFFEESVDIIEQGKSGRDIFLLCSGTIDVLVDDLVVVEMSAPTLVGDKGIVSANSQRAATIRISSNKPALVIKIPMGTFIREFKDTTIRDESFIQEKKVFENVFETVQERLFEFIYLQKSLWEQANNTIQLLNQQIYAKQLDNLIDPKWTHDAWSIAQNYVKSKFGINWPANIPINAKNLNIYLRKYFDVKYKTATSPDDLVRKKLEWRNTLTEIAGRVTRSIPDDKKAILPLDIELFNPSIYRMRLIGLQNQLEKRYKARAVIKPENKMNQAAFFGKGEKSNEFNLPLYLEYFFKAYQVKNPRRLLAQVGQKCALIAAECENNFNSSVVKMQKFLEEVKSRNISLEQTKNKKEIDPGLVRSWIAALIRGVHHYRDSSPSIDGQTLGVIKFSENTYPSFSNLIKAHRVQFTRDKMNQAFVNLIKTTQFQSEYLSKQMLYNVFHLCSIERGDTIPESQQHENYWFPLTDDLVVNLQEEPLFKINSCTPVGGEYWNSTSENSDEAAGKDLTITTEEDSILMVLPKKRLPWISFPNPDADALITQYLPLMQWFIDKKIELISFLQKERDGVVDEWTEIKNGLARSQKIAAFEQKALKLPKADYNRIISWLNGTLGMKLNPEEVFPSNKISKRIYNFFLHSATVDFPELSIEQRGNQAYTKWRNLLFELTEQIPALRKVVGELPGKDPVPIWDVLAKQLTPSVSPFAKDTWEKQNPITSGSPNLNLMSILHPDKHENPGEAVELFLKIEEQFSKILFQTVLELKEHKKTLSELYELRSQSDSGSVADAEQVDMRQESIKNLLRILNKAS